MGEAYRGLTVRIGADTSKLNLAMSNLRKASGSLRRDFANLSKAMRIDPSNTRLASAHMRTLRDQAQVAASEAARLNHAFRQIGERDAFGKAGTKIKELASGTRNLKMEAELARGEYNRLNTELEQVYARMATQRTGKKSGEQWEKERDRIKELAAEYRKGGEAKREFDRILSETFAAGKEPDWLKGSGEKASAEVMKVRTEVNGLYTEMKRLDEAAGLQEIGNDALLAETRIREMYAQMTKLYEAELRLGKGDIARLANEFELAGMKAREAKGHVDAFDEALRLDPSSIDAANGKMDAMRQHLRAVEQQAETASDRVRQMANAGYDKALANARALGKSAEQLNQEYTEARSKLTQVNRELTLAREHAAGVEKEFGKASPEAAEAASKVEKLETKVREARVEANRLNREMKTVNKGHALLEAESEAAKAKAEFKALRAEITGTKNATAALGVSIKNIGYAGMATLSPAMMMVGMHMVQAADDIDAAYRDMRKTVQGTDADFENLKAAAEEFASTHVTSADQLLEIMSIGGQLGLAVDELQAFSETVANLDVATNMATEDIAADLGKMASVLGMTSDEYDNFGDALVRLGNNEPAFESDIMTITTRFMGIGKVVGMSADEMLAWATAATATGQKAEAAGSSMQRFISNMETAVASGGDALEKWAQVAGMSSEEFANLFNTDASAAMYAFIEGLGDMQKSGESVNQMLGELGINNVRDKQLIEGLANQMANATDENNVLRDSLLMSKDAWNGISDQWGQAGDAANEAAKKAEGFSGQLAILKNNGQVLLAELAEGAAPILKIMNDLVQSLTQTFMNLPDGMKTAIVVIGGLAGVMPYLATAIGVTMTSVTNMTAKLGEMAGAWRKAVNAQKYLDSSMMVMNKGTWSQAFAAQRNAANATNGFSNALRNAGKQVGRFVSGAAAIGKSIMGSVGPMLAFVAAAAAIGYVTAKFVEAKKEAERFEKVTKGLEDATSSFASELEIAAGKGAAWGEAFGRTRPDVDEVTDGLSRHVDAIRDTTTEMNTSIGSLEAYREVINRFKDSTELTDDEMALLEWAINGVNEATGSAFTAQDLLNGAYADQLDYINQVIDAKERLLYANAAESILTEAISAEIESKNALEAEQDYYDQQLKARDDFIEKYRELGYTVKRREDGGYVAISEGTGWGGRDEVVAKFDAKDLRESEDRVAQYEREYAAAHRATEQARDTVREYGALASTAQELATYLNSVDMLPEEIDDDAFANAGRSVDEYAESLSRLGVTTADLSKMTPEELATITQAYLDLGEEGLRDALKGLGFELEGLAEGAAGLEEVFLEIDGQTMHFYVDDDGTITDALGNVQDFHREIWEIDGNSVAVYVDDDGTVRGVTDEMLSLEDYKLENNIIVGADTTQVNAAIGALEARRLWLTANVGANLNPLSTAINNFFRNNQWTASVKANISAKIGGAASGGFIPAHAAGGFNGIVTRPMLTNQGWVGEAGAEAIMRWAGGTAIVPLENRQYVRPFARTVAEEMPMAFGGYSLSAADIAAALAQLNLQVRMDSGELVGVLVNNSRRKAAMNVG